MLGAEAAAVCFWVGLQEDGAAVAGGAGVGYWRREAGWCDGGRECEVVVGCA